MTTAFEVVDRQRKYTEAERDELFEAIGDALLAGDKEEANRLVKHMPVHPRWAKIIADVFGKEFLLKTFNVTHANEVFGEGWLNDIR